MTTPLKCPDCGSVLELITREDGGMISEPYFPKYPIRDRELPRKERPADFAACTGCEFHVEIKSGMAAGVL